MCLLEENPEDWKWATMSPVSVGNGFDNILIYYPEEDKLLVRGSSNVTLTGLNVARRHFETIFKNGLKVPIDDINECNLRLAHVPAEYCEDPKILSAISYEIGAQIQPRYAKDGDSGYHTLRFTSYVKLVLERRENIHGECLARCDHLSKEVALRKVQKSRVDSIERAQRIIRNGLQHPISGGLPSLGKRK
jgi:hypothetical protein